LVQKKYPKDYFRQHKPEDVTKNIPLGFTKQRVRITTEINFYVLVEKAGRLHGFSILRCVFFYVGVQYFEKKPSWATYIATSSLSTMWP
jgi:hypothetical protein